MNDVLTVMNSGTTSGLIVLVMIIDAAAPDNALRIDNALLKSCHRHGRFDGGARRIDTSQRTVPKRLVRVGGQRFYVVVIGGQIEGRIVDTGKHIIVFRVHHNNRTGLCVTVCFLHLSDKRRKCLIRCFLKLRVNRQNDIVAGNRLFGINLRGVSVLIDINRFFARFASEILFTGIFDSAFSDHVVERIALIFLRLVFFGAYHADKSEHMRRNGSVKILSFRFHLNINAHIGAVVFLDSRNDLV